MPRGPQATRLETPFPCASNASLRCAPCTCSARMGGQRAAAECNSPCSPVRMHRRPDRTRAERRARYRVNPSANNDLDDTSSLLQSRRGSHFRPLLLSIMTRPKEQCGGTPHCRRRDCWFVDEVIVVRVRHSEPGAVEHHDWAVEPRRARPARSGIRRPSPANQRWANAARRSRSNCSRASCQLGGVRPAGFGAGAASPGVGVCVAADSGSAGSIKRVFNIWGRLARELLLQRCDVEPRALPADQPLREVEHVQQPDLHLLAVAC